MERDHPLNAVWLQNSVRHIARQRARDREGIVHDSRRRRREAPSAAVSVRRRWNHLHNALGYREFFWIQRRHQQPQRFTLLRRRNNGRWRLSIATQCEGVL